MDNNNKLNKLVKKLPEIYQPIFGHPNLGGNHSRPCDDRLQHIIEICLALKKALGRNIKILDLGCAQGYFSLSMAQHTNSIVHGIDFQDANINVCKELAHENPQLNVVFNKERIEKNLSSIKENEYDLIICLSVLHHIAYEKGQEYVASMLSNISNKVSAIVLELAVKEEPLYWANSLPKNPKDLIKNYSFIFEIQKNSTHLSSIKRPIYFASNKYWYLNGMAGPFVNFQTKSHKLASAKNRKYFFHNSTIVKLFDINQEDGEINYKEIFAEANLLKSPPINMRLPKLISYGANEKHSWLIREKIEGDLLSDKIQSFKNNDLDKIITSILTQLINLEKSKLYHNDLRLWNIVINNNNETSLIDYGSISDKPIDCVWPFNVYLSFFIFLHEIFTREYNGRGDIKSTWISPFNLPEPYNLKLRRLWQYPLCDWSFELIQKMLVDDQSTVQNSDYKENPSVAWMAAIEQIITQNSKEIYEIKKSSQRANNRIDEMIKPYKKLKIILTTLTTSIQKICKKLINRY